MTPIDFTRPVRTRDGQLVRIYATDGNGLYPVHGAIEVQPGKWELHRWTKDGRYLVDEIDPNPHSYDLFQVPVETAVWVNVYPDETWTAHVTKASADARAKHERVGCNRVVLRNEFDEEPAK